MVAWGLWGQREGTWGPPTGAGLTCGARGAALGVDGRLGQQAVVGPMAAIGAALAQQAL